MSAWKIKTAMKKLMFRGTTQELENLLADIEDELRKTASMGDCLSEFRRVLARHIDRIDAQRPRAGNGHPYYYVSPCGEVATGYECGTYTDNNLYKARNYFLIKEEAELYTEAVKAVFLGKAGAKDE
jgi:hypothetical protein